MATEQRTYSKRFVYALGLFAAAMTIFGAVVSREHHSAESARNGAISRLVALEARSLQSSDPSLAMQLALVAYRTQGTTEARSVLLDTTAGEMPTRLLGPVGQTSMALGEDGHLVAIAYRAGDQLKLYSLRYSTLKWLASVPAGPKSAKVDAVAISDSGRLVATGDGGGLVTLWNVASPRHPRQLTTLRAGSQAVSGLSFSPGGGALAAADADGSVQRWALADPRHPDPAAVLVAPGRPELRAVSYSHDGKTLAAVGRRGALDVWRAHAGSNPLSTLSVGATALNAVTYSPDGHTLAAGGHDGVVRLWTLGGGGRPIATRGSLTGTGPVTSLAFSRDGRYLAAGSSDNSVHIWATAHWDEAATLPHPIGVSDVAFTDGDRHLLSSDTAGTTRIWQFPPVSTRTTAFPAQALTFTSDQPRLTASGAGAQTEQWDVANEWRPAPVGSWYAAPASSAPPIDAYWTKTTTTTTPSGTPTTVIGPLALPFNPHAGDKALRETQAATRVIGSALSPNGDLFAAAGTDKLVWLWDVTDPSHPRLIRELSGFTRWAYTVAFSGTSQTLFAGSADHTIRMWDVSTPNDPVELANSPLTGPASTIEQLALSPDSRTLAAVTAEGQVWLWAVGTPRKASLTATLMAASGKLSSVVFSPSDNTLVVSGSNRRLTFWHYRPYQAVNRICALAGTPITPAEWQQYVVGAPYDPPCQNWTAPVPAVAATP